MSATPEQIAAAWGAWRVRHKGSMGPGPGFVEAIDAALAASPDPRITALEKENAELRKALEFYADSKNWDDGHFKMDEPNAIVLVTSTIDQDQGDLARSTMEDIHREQREVPRLRPARPRKPSEAEGREAE